MTAPGSPTHEELMQSLKDLGVSIDKLRTERDSLREKNKELVNAIEEILEGLDRHDEANFQCESMEGAEGASDARRVAEDALANATRGIL